MTYMKMLPGPKAALVAALRSGDYKQVHGSLHVVNEGYCCLGVACVKAIEDGVVLDRSERHDMGRLIEAFNGNFGGLPDATARWLFGPTCHDTSAMRDMAEATTWRLIEMNDTERKTFHQIAAWIEAEL